MIGPTLREARQMLDERLGPMSRAERVAMESLDARLRRVEREHREHHAELGTPLCWSCDYPLTQPERVVRVTLANGAGEAACCGSLCASKVKQLVGDPILYGDGR